MKQLFMIAAGACMIASCTGNATEQSQKKSKNFHDYTERFTLQLWKQFPGFGSAMGFHACDSVLPIPDEQTRLADDAFAKAHLDSLNAFELSDLSDNDRTDYLMIRNYLQSVIWSNDTEKAWQWNPSQYNVCERFAEILNGSYSTLEARLRSISVRLGNVPAYYEAARKNILNPTREHTQLAIDQNTGGASVFEKDLPEKIRASQLDSSEKTAMLDKCRNAAEAIRDFAAWLKSNPNPQPRSFRLGRELYQQKFAYEIQSGSSLETMHERALARKRELHGLMFSTAQKLWPAYMGSKVAPRDSLQLIRQVIDKISLNHTTPDSFQATIEKQIPELVAFVNRKQLITLDPSKPLVVRREPDYMAGVAGASISAPGPYDKNGNTYYNVGSLSGWPADKAESYLREYNRYTLQILNIHEAIPGHYTQLVYANQSPSIIKSIFGSGTMIEGWAVYTERMMLENGYGAPEGSNEATPEMWLMYYKWNLRSTCNFLLDYGVHTAELSEEAAMKLLTEEAFQQKAEAEGKWKRVSVTQVQLCCYFTGFSEIYSLREEMKQKQGTAFSLKQFHEQFLSYGSAPVKYIREMMIRK
ncbi:DUF885 domain-containing protein [Rurimicrobium arvi]|uniref:DUF885 domain-containing protein n=1 Tax=Rurimicrobium arvi TaxID=2049916 RepID=A0ABP8MI67_9BACT